jgi:hypothetical protein
MATKWTKKFAVDLAERVFATFLGALTTALALVEGTPIDWSDGQAVWTVLGVPVVFALIKGLLANLAAPETGASLIPEAPPGPKVNPDNGATDILYAAGAALVLLAVVLLVTTLLKAFVVSWIVIIVFAVVGLFLLFWRSGGVRL